MKVRNVEKKIFGEHRNLMGTSEIDSKYKYVKLARGLPTFGVHFFLVKVCHTVTEVCLFSLAVPSLYCIPTSNIRDLDCHSISILVLCLPYYTSTYINQQTSVPSQKPELLHSGYYITYSKLVTLPDNRWISVFGVIRFSQSDICGIAPYSFSSDRWATSQQ